MKKLSQELYNLDLSNKYLRNVDFSNTHLVNINFKETDLSNADFTNSRFDNVNLQETNLSGVRGLPSAIEIMDSIFEKTKEGYIGYKIFGAYYSIPDYWEIKEGSIINEVVNPDRTCCCGSGISVGTKDYILNIIKEDRLGDVDIWKVLIKWEWLLGVIVPYDTCGEIRCERVQLLEAVQR